MGCHNETEFSDHSKSSIFRKRLQREEASVYPHRNSSARAKLQGTQKGTYSLCCWELAWEVLEVTGCCTIAQSHKLSESGKL